MGVDNSGVFVVGDKISNLDINMFPKPPEDFIEDDVFEYYCWNTSDIIKTRLNWRLREPAGYEKSGVFGFCLESPSYGSADFDYISFLVDLDVISKKWIEWTTDKPRVFIMNIQS